MNKEKMWLFAGIILGVLVISGSVSYAWFTASVTHNNQENTVVEAGNMLLKFKESNNISLDNALPGSTARKEFSVENTGNLATTYKLYFSELINTFEDKTDLVYTLASTEAGITISDTQVPSESGEITTSLIEIGVGEKHNYVLTVKFLSKDEDQNDNQGKSFSAKITVNDYKKSPESILDTGKVVNTKLKQLAHPEDEYITETSYESDITSIQIASSLDNNADKVIISSDKSKKDIYAWYDNGTIYIYTDSDTIYLNEDSDSLFSYFAGLTSLDLSHFDTSFVTSMARMFYNLSNVTSLNLEKFDTSHVTDMSEMFKNVGGLSELDLSSFNTSKVTKMDDMFSYTGYIDVLDLSTWDISSLESASYIFVNAKAKKIDISNWDFTNYSSKGGSFDYIFRYNYYTENIVLKNTKGYGSDISNMFYNVGMLKTIDVTGIDTTNVTNMNALFRYCYKLENIIGIADMDVANVTDMGYMFQRNGLQTLDLSAWNTVSLTNMEYMFNALDNLTSINLGGYFNTSNVTNMSYLFYNSSGLVTLDLSNFDTSKVTSMYYMFTNLTNLTTVYVSSSWSTANVDENECLFGFNPNLVGGNGTTYDDTKYKVDYAHVDGGTSNPGYLTEKI